MIVGTCGFCSTGSSAVSDYLKEFEEFQVLDKFEFTLCYLPDGLEDLYYHLVQRISRDDSCTIAIPRFRAFIERNKKLLTKDTKLSSNYLDELTNSFLDSLIQMRWKGSRRSDIIFHDGIIRRKIYSLFKHKIIPFINSINHKCVDFYPYRILEISVNPINADYLFKKYVRDLLVLIGADFSKNIVLDQPFVGNDPCASFHFFDDPYAIVVDRDPRDNYIFAKEYLYKKGKYIPINSVDEFVKYYKLMRDNMPYKLENAKVLRINFEDMVYNYDNTTKKIRNFLNLGYPSKPKSIFDPNLSVNNTQLVLKFPQYVDDVKYIEENLTEYLYDFSRFPIPDNNGKMFMGKSPLNK